MTRTTRLPRVTPDGRKRLRVVFFVFLLTFVASRLLVFLIMSRRIPDLFLVLGGTHVHHLNYGIFLLGAVGAYLLFLTPTQQGLRVATVLFGIGLGLTFDEFGMWLHLGGGYWQRASFDAVMVLGAALGLLAYAPPLDHLKARQRAAGVIVLVVMVLFYAGLVQSFRFAGRIEERFAPLERLGPP